MLIDTHCHLDDPVYQDDFDELIARQQQFGVERIIVPGVNLTSLSTVPKTCDRYPDYLYPCIGLHPEDVHEDYQMVLDALHAMLSTRKWTAIGEIGLDYHFCKTFQSQQVDAFRLQLRWARAENLPVIIHSRDATADCLSVLQEVMTEPMDYPLRGVMHCFSGSREVAEQIVAKGLYLGIGGVITFKNSKVAEHIANIGLEWIVLETDGPYLSPTPLRGQRNESRYIQYVAEALAATYQCDIEEVYKQTTANAKRLFF